MQSDHEHWAGVLSEAVADRMVSLMIQGLCILEDSDVEEQRSAASQSKEWLRGKEAGSVTILHLLVAQMSVNGGIVLRREGSREGVFYFKDAVPS